MIHCDKCWLPACTLIELCSQPCGFSQKWGSISNIRIMQSLFGYQFSLLYSVSLILTSSDYTKIKVDFLMSINNKKAALKLMTITIISRIIVVPQFKTFSTISMKKTQKFKINRAKNIIRTRGYVLITSDTVT